MTIIAITNNKGGVLKTTSVTALAGVLFLEGKRVLIVDADNQGNAAVAFGYNPDDFGVTLYDVMKAEIPIRQAIIRVHDEAEPKGLKAIGEKVGKLVGKVPPNRGGCIDLLPSNDDMALLDFEVLSDNRRYSSPFRMLKTVLEDIRGEYDVILIDCPPNMGLMQGNALTAATGVLVPFQPEKFSMRSLVKILQAIKDFQAVHNPGLELVGVFPTLVDKRTVLHARIIEDARAYAMENNFVMFDTVIPRSVRHATSVAFDELPLTLSAPSDPLSLVFRDLIEECRKKGVLS